MRIPTRTAITKKMPTCMLLPSQDTCLHISVSWAFFFPILQYQEQIIAFHLAPTSLASNNVTEGELKSLWLHISPPAAGLPGLVM